VRKLFFVGVMLVLLTVGCLGDGATETQRVVNLELGKTVYENNCRVCHGPEGRGIVSIGSADLTSARVKTLSREQKVDQVTNGGEQMPPFAKALTKEEIEAVVDYTDTL
jgi:mono/diheme cytochrome c family protein